MKNKLIIAIVFLLFLTSCTTVREYEKININDPDMALSMSKYKKFIINFHVYREGASGANGGKSGGGCGCN